MNRKWWQAGGLLLIGATAGWLASTSRAPDTRGAVEDEVLAIVAGDAITWTDVESVNPEPFLDLARQKQQLTEQALEQAIRIRLVEVEAAARGMAPPELVDAAVYDGVPEPTDEEIDRFYDRNRLQQPKAQIAPQIRANLVQQARNERYEEFLVELRAKHGVESRLEPLRSVVATEGHPSKGAEDAPVTIVEFSDFQCPYCRQLLSALDQIEDAYGDYVRVVYRHFPLSSIHPDAERAAEASACAGELGAFWEMHDALFADQDALSEQGLRRTARVLGLDEARFNECLTSGRQQERVAADREAGRRLGVVATPSLFVNGRFLSGIQEAEAIAAVVLDELRRAGQSVDEVRLEPYRTEVAADGFPSKGPPEAPVTIVEFADFECPYCYQLLGTLEEVMEAYPDQVRLVYRQFPLASIHPQALKAAEASLCAEDQGMFWELHDAMYANQTALGVEDLKRTAVSLGLDGPRFNQCLDSAERAAEVAGDLRAGRAAGVTGTPAMFINGRFLSGVQRFPTIAAIVEDELGRVGR